MKTYIVDIDNTICHTENSQYSLSRPFMDRIAKINELYNQGNRIIYWTARGGNSGIDWSEFTKTQLDSWGCCYHELRLGKPVYDIWVDDKAINSEEYFK